MESIITKAVLSVLGVGLMFASQPMTDTTKTATYEETTLQQETGPETPIWLLKLIQCESGGDPSAIGDSGKALGILQFHKGTFVSYAKKYDLFPQAEDAEIENFWGDSMSQIRLAELILKEQNGWKHWFVCSKKTGLDKVKFE